MAENKIQELPGITGLRGFFALWVFIFHIEYGLAMMDSSLSEYIPLWLYKFIDSGSWGVDGFFILSGFILTHKYYSEFSKNIQLKQYLRFLIFRIARFYPVHLFVLLVYAALIISGFKFSEMNCMLTAPSQKDCNISYEMESSSEDCSNKQQTEFCDRFSTTSFFKHIFLISSWKKDAPLTWNMPAWSISSEWLAYLLFPFLIFFIIRKVTSIFLLSLLGIGTILTMLYFLWTGNYSPATLVAEVGFLRISGHFIFGCLLCRLIQYKSIQKLNWSFIGLMSYIGIVAFSRSHNEFAFPFLLGLVVVACSQNKSILSRYYSKNVNQWLGRISYSLYMTQVLTFDILGLIFSSSDDAQKMSGWETLGTFIFLMFVPIGMAFLVFHFIEEASRRKIKQWVKF